MKNRLYDVFLYISELLVNPANK